MNPDFQPLDVELVPRFSDVATFLRTRRHAICPEIDIGLCGVPFDLGLNYRSGPRQGPAGVREASRIIRQLHPTSGIRPYDMCNVADVGDAPINPLDKDVSIQQIQDFFTLLKQNGIRPIAVGGDHTIPTPIIRALAADRPVGLLQIDAHADVLDSLYGTKINHATFMRRTMEEGLLDPNRVVQLGLRGSRFGAEDIQFGLDSGYHVITMDAYEEMGRAAFIELLNKAIGDGPFYISLDIDGIDPIGGLIPRDVQVILRSLLGKNLIGADISEVAPAYDPTGITCVTAANFMFEILCVMAQAVTQEKSG